MCVPEDACTMGVWAGLSIVRSASEKGPVAFTTPFARMSNSLPVSASRTRAP